MSPQSVFERRKHPPIGWLSPLALLALSALACAALIGGTPEASPPTPVPSAQADQPEATTPPQAPEPAEAPAAAELDRRDQLAQVSHWFYYLDFNPESDVYERIAASSYDMVVIEPIFTEQENTDFPVEEAVAQMHTAPQPKLVIAYIDIGQAEEWRTYWQDGWQIGDPDWIVALDPDGWEGNFPVAYWRDEWRQIWLDEDGYMQQLLDAGFDGIYLDWVEAYSDENVAAAAGADGVDAVEEMKRWVADLADYARDQQPDFIVIAQNAAELAEHDDYVEIIDAIAQEQTWFDGGADNDPAGDCPLPRSEDEVESDEYVASLSEGCLSLYVDYPESTLHVSSEWYLEYLTMARDKGLVIFTVDYALDAENVSWVYQTSRELGFVPFVGERSLSTYIEPVP